MDTLYKVYLKGISEELAGYEKITPAIIRKNATLPFLEFAGKRAFVTPQIGAGVWFLSGKYLSGNLYFRR